MSGIRKRSLLHKKAHRFLTQPRVSAITQPRTRKRCAIGTKKYHDALNFGAWSKICWFLRLPCNQVYLECLRHFSGITRHNILPRNVKSKFYFLRSFIFLPLFLKCYFCEVKSWRGGRSRRGERLQAQGAKKHAGYFTSVREIFQYFFQQGSIYSLTLPVGSVSASLFNIARTSSGWFDIGRK